MEDKTTGTSPATTDYKAELEKAQQIILDKDKELKQARFTLTKKNIEDKKSKVFKEDEDESETPDEDQVIKSIVKQELSKTRSEDYLAKHSNNADEIALAKFHLENTINPSGNPEVDALAALSVANQSTLRKQNDELKTALINRNNIGATSSASGGGNKAEINEFSKYLTSEQEATLRTKHGFNDAMIKAFLDKKGSRQS